MLKTLPQDMHRLTPEAYRAARKLPLAVVLDNVRSLYNIGSVLRTADAFRVAQVWLCGITATPDGTEHAEQEIHKTALGAEHTVEWHYAPTTDLALDALAAQGYTLAAVEQCQGSTMLQDFKPYGSETCAPSGHSSLITPHSSLSETPHPSLSETSHSSLSETPYAVVLGNEVHGVAQHIVDRCQLCLEIPQFGTKHSLNVAVTAGIIMWHFAQFALDK